MPVILADMLAGLHPVHDDADAMDGRAQNWRKSGILGLVVDIGIPVIEAETNLAAAAGVAVNPRLALFLLRPLTLFLLVPKTATHVFPPLNFPNKKAKRLN
jgi:hypothetical protein